MFNFFESRVGAIGRFRHDSDDGPPAGLLAFYWHFVKQTKGLYAAILITGLCVALIDTLIPVFIGRLVSIMTTEDPAGGLGTNAWLLLGMALLLLIGRPTVVAIDSLVRNNAMTPGVSTLIRWQCHWHVLRQSMTFFQNDFAGRIAYRVMNTGNALRESVVAVIRAVWYITAYGLSALVLMLATDLRLGIPTILWMVAYVQFLRYFVPRMRDFARSSSEARSTVVGRIVDSYSNILSVKLFARTRDEDIHVREAMQEHRERSEIHMRLVTKFMLVLTVMNASLVVSTGGIGLWLWSLGIVKPAVVATALPLVWQIANISNWVSFEVTTIFENVGVVQESSQSIALPRSTLDSKNARRLNIGRGEIRFENVTFQHDKAEVGGRPTIDGLSLHIQACERVGIVGRSGAGKSTLMNLLLRFYDMQDGRITIDNQDIRQVTQDSLRSSIGMVTQDAALLNRSIESNIRYGKPEATRNEVIAAARQARAHTFVEALLDWKGREGYDAHVGERGVKLSGGQRQRIALARVLLKNAPILILDEATSALDSETEAAIQEQLESLMQSKTVIVIAHRLSTMIRMDRLIVINEGQIVEEGTHVQLLQQKGFYAQLWSRQSGGFL